MIKILMGGSPCTHWSVCRPKDREVTSSGIGWELFKNYIIAKEKFRPDFYLYENVASMSKDIQTAINGKLTDNFYQINGGLVSAAERDRFYWTNINVGKMPIDKGLVLQDVLEKNVSEKYFYDHPLIDIDMSKQVCATMDFKNNDMHKRVFNPKFKVHTLTTCGGGNTQKKVMDNGRARKLTPIEYERCMTLPDGYTKTVSDTWRYTCCGNGWTAEIIKHILSFAKIPQSENIFVLSLYDGIATGRYCLDSLGYKNIEYHSYEIEPHAIKVALSNYPDIKEHGDAFALRDKSWHIEKENRP